MFGFWDSKPKHIRNRDGYERLTASERRCVRDRGELSSRQQKKVVKGNRRYKKGWF